MKKLILVLAAAAALSATVNAQEAPPASADFQNYMRSSQSTQAVLLENSRQILDRLTGIESTVVGLVPPAALTGPLAEATALEERIQALEAKLAETVAVEAVVAADGDTSLGSESAEQLQSNINTIWILTAAVLVFFMQAGFCLLELGITRSKNAINVCMKNALDFSTGAICFLFVGFALMFGVTYQGWFGLGPFWLSEFAGDNSFWAFWLFQTMFAATAATIISGAMAERTKFIGYVAFTVVMTSLIYPVVGHWAWGSLAGDFGFGGTEGWLEAMGYADFAGSGVVHAVGGAAALAGVMILGPRVGRFREDGSPNLLAGHNLPMAALGTFILWFGWYGFNAGSTLAGDASIGRIAANTTLAPAAGALAAMFAIWITQGRPDMGMTLNGALGGLVGITANCDMVTPASAVIIGIVAGVVATLGTQLLERMRIDDAVGAVPVHLFCGWWGVLAVAFFNEEGFSVQQLQVQAIGIASITAAAFFAALIAFKLIDLIIGLRATDDEQDLGLDFTEHSSTAYADFLTGEQNLNSSDDWREKSRDKASASGASGDTAPIKTKA